MDQLIIAGNNTDAGKTVVSAILTAMLQATYWKPIECGDSDTAFIKTLHLPTLPPRYAFKTPCSPHYAAELENCRITPFSPAAVKPLIIETAGGVLTPLAASFTNLDLYSTWNCPWILVSRHVLGSINQTLLTLEALHKRKVNLIGIIFNGCPDPCSEPPILKAAQVPCFGRLWPESQITRFTLQKYAKLWKIPSGAPAPK